MLYLLCSVGLCSVGLGTVALDSVALDSVPLKRTAYCFEIRGLRPSMAEWLTSPDSVVKQVRRPPDTAGILRKKPANPGQHHAAFDSDHGYHLT